jgi:hypothetical protein
MTIRSLPGSYIAFSEDVWEWLSTLKGAGVVQWRLIDAALRIVKNMAKDGEFVDYLTECSVMDDAQKAIVKKALAGAK